MKRTADYWERKEETKERAEFLMRLREEREREQYRPDLRNACPHCHMIRSAYEVEKGTCDNCGLVRAAI